MAAPIDAARLPETLDALARTAETPARDLLAWRAAVVDAIGRVDAGLDAHVTADESPQGFLARSVERAPRLAPALDRQRADHRELQALLGAAASAARGAREPTGVDVTRRAVRTAIARIARHLHTSDLLEWEIANEDLGTGD